MTNFENQRVHFNTLRSPSGRRRLTGGGYIYRVLRPERATVAVERGPDGNWQIHQLRAKQNAEVGEETERAVVTWVREYSVSV